MILLALEGTSWAEVWTSCRRRAETVRMDLPSRNLAGCQRMVNETDNRSRISPKLPCFLLRIREFAQRTQYFLNDPRPLFLVEGKNLRQGSLVNASTM